MRDGTKFSEAEPSADKEPSATSKFSDDTASSQAKDDSNIVLLDHDRLSALASEDPEAFERYREKLYQKVIDRAPIELQRRLKGIQFKINMARKAATNPVSSCMKISEMMHDSFVELKLALANPQKYLHEQKSTKVESADIIPLFPERKPKS